MTDHYFQYNEEELSALCKKDKRLAQAIEQIGPIQRACNPDLFEALINSIVGQQISTKAHSTIWQRMKENISAITPQSIQGMDSESLQAFGLSFRKVEYMKNLAEKVLQEEFSIHALHDMDDASVCAALSQLKGIGVWTAEMMMIFSMQRRNILSYGDLAILRGLRMLYRHRSISRELFAKYHRRYSPHASIASLYLWAIAGGAIEGLSDPAPAKKKKK